MVTGVTVMLGTIIAMAVIQRHAQRRRQGQATVTHYLTRSSNDVQAAKELPVSERMFIREKLRNLSPAQQ